MAKSQTPANVPADDQTKVPPTGDQEGQTPGNGADAQTPGTGTDGGNADQTGTDGTGTDGTTPETATATEPAKKGNRGKKAPLFAVTPEEVNGLYEFGSSDVISRANIPADVLRISAINRLRNAWEAWHTAKTQLRSTRSAWQTAFNEFKAQGEVTVTSKLGTLQEREATLYAEMALAMKAKDMAASSAAFDALELVRSEIAEIEELKKNKVTSPKEGAKKAAQKAWKEAQTVEATARKEFQLCFFRVMTMGANFTDAQAADYARLIATQPKISPALTEADGTFPTEPITLNFGDVDDDDETVADAADKADEAKTDVPKDGATDQTDADKSE